MFISILFLFCHYLSQKNVKHSTMVHRIKKIQIKNKRMGVFFFIEKLSTFIAMEEGELVGEDTTSKAKEH